MSQNNEKLPEWTAEEKQKMLQKMVELAAKAPTDPLMPVEQRPISDFTTFFADWELKGDDILVHLYPRAGAEDIWTSGHYEPYCAKCSSSVPVPKSRKDVKPCPRCGHTGLRYIPGRTERPPEKVAFPKNMDARLKVSADCVWMGDVAIDPVQELGSWVVQFQRALVTAKTMGVDQFIDKFLSRVDEELEK